MSFKEEMNEFASRKNNEIRHYVSLISSLYSIQTFSDEKKIIGEMKEIIELISYVRECDPKKSEKWMEHLNSELKKEMETYSCDSMLSKFKMLKTQMEEETQ